MTRFCWLLAAAVVFQSGSSLAAGDKKPAGVKGANITWKRTVVDKAFRSEGVAVADFNKDGKMDIFVGDVWYEAPDWKMHVIRREQPYDPKAYSESFGCFADDFNGDGYADVIVIPFPGKACYWYENPGKGGKDWKPHQLTNSACNETPIYVDLFKTGKRLLVMGWQPEGKTNQGEMCYFLPGKDPTKPWERHSISGPSAPGQEVPGTQRFSHGLGHGDVNGDGRVDILVPQGWWEQPAKIDGAPWTFHRTALGANAADMYAFDIDGDGKNDVISSSAHNTGLWWHQQKDAKTFITRDLFPTPVSLANLPKDHGLSAEEVAVFQALNKLRDQDKKAPWRINLALCAQARKAVGSKGPFKYDGVRLLSPSFGMVQFDAAGIAKAVMTMLVDTNKQVTPGLEVGVGVVQSKGTYECIVFIGDRKLFALPGQTHALHLVDINGDGLKDLVTGRRFWAHGPKGDDHPADPAYIYWFEAKRGSDGVTSFIPHLIDDDSGIGTQFAIADMNGDGLLDVIVSNKKGVFVFIQTRDGATPGRE